jgi:hypothetical protein
MKCQKRRKPYRGTSGLEGGFEGDAGRFRKQQPARKVREEPSDSVTRDPARDQGRGPTLTMRPESLAQVVHSVPLAGPV